MLFWGHPHTTGFPSIDYVVSSTRFEPVAPALTAPPTLAPALAPALPPGPVPPTGRGQGHAMAAQASRGHHVIEQLVLFDSLSFRMASPTTPTLTSSTPTPPPLPPKAPPAPHVFFADPAWAFLVHHGRTIDDLPFDPYAAAFPVGLPGSGVRLYSCQQVRPILLPHLFPRE